MQRSLVRAHVCPSMCSLSGICHRHGRVPFAIHPPAGMSGIVALFFSGICHSHYTFYSASVSAQVRPSAHAMGLWLVAW